MIKRSLGELGINRDIHPLEYWENNYNQGYIDEEDILDGFITEHGNIKVKHKDGRWADVHDKLPCIDGRWLYGVRWWLSEWEIEELGEA